MSTTTNDTRWLVINAGTRQRSVVDAYLYDHTTIVATYDDGRVTVHIAVTVDPRSNPDATFMAEYQAGRFGSGWIPTTVCETFGQAVNEAFAMMNAADR